MDLTRFMACWPYTLAQECPFPNDWSNPRNFSNDPGDPGGATMDGIIQAEYSQYLREHNMQIVSVRHISKQEGQDIYINGYWLPHCPNLPVGLDMQFFDADVNEGGKEAVKILQVAVGVANDGVWGPRTQAAVEGITSVPDVIGKFTQRREVVYHQTSGFDRFGRDWIRRAQEIGNTSLAMANGTAMHPKAMPLGTLKHVPRAMWYIEGVAK